MRNRGFTLIELMIVVAIIGIIAAIAIPNFQRFQARRDMKPGTKAVIVDPFEVVVKNKGTIGTSRDHFPEGSVCITRDGDVMTLVGTDKGRALVRLLSPGADASGCCPSGTLFFIPSSDFVSLMRSESETDSGVVNRLLEQERKTQR